MKSAKYFMVILAICFSGYCFGQEPTLTINEFKTRELKEFDGNGEAITLKKLQNGFTLRIKSSTSINKVELKKDGNFVESTLPTPTSEASYSKIYKGVKPAVVDNAVEIQLSKTGESPVIVKLVVSPEEQESNSCVPTKLPEKCEANKDYSNKFGEEATYYDSRKIVYVYDFNKDPSKRELYKITLKSKNERNKLSTDDERAGHQGLNIQVVNFNRETLTAGRNVKFKIFNINKFMYDVSIADSVIQFDSEPSALFSRLFLGDSTLLSSLMGTFSDVTKMQSNVPDLDKLSKDIKCFLEKYNWLQNQLLSAYDPCYSFPCCYSIEYIELANSLIAIRADAVKIQQQIENKKKTVAGNKKKMEDCDKVKADIKANDEKIKVLKNKATLSETEKKDLAELEKKQQELNGKVCKDEEYESYKKMKDDAEKELSDMSASNTLLSNLPSDQELRKVIVFLRNMVETNNSHTSDFISLNGNMLELIINITSKDSIFKHFSIPEYKVNPIQIQIPILGKPFVSFSSGTFIGLGKQLQNKTYSWQETVGSNNTADSSNYTLVESGYTLPAMGFCALGNFEWKFSRSFGLGGSAGVGLSIEKSPRLAYLGGVSLFLGDLRQFTITGGYIGMQVNKLTNNFQSVSDNQVIFTSKPNIEYYKEFKVGGFISLTYTPFKIYKTKTVKSQNR